MHALELESAILGAVRAIVKEDIAMENAAAWPSSVIECEKRVQEALETVTMALRKEMLMWAHRAAKGSKDCSEA